MCQVVSESGADFIKTSTGFSTAGATFEDIRLFKENVAPHVKIKAAGGISSFDDAEKFVELGADRLGTSQSGQNTGSRDKNMKGMVIDYGRIESQKQLRREKRHIHHIRILKWGFV